MTLDSLHAPGNATHGFMDFMLMMGVAGENAKADYVDTLRPVPHHGGVLHLVPERSAGMSKYLLNKFLFTVDRDPDLVERYREDPRGTVTWWEAERANLILNCPAGESSTWLAFDERSARHWPATTTRRCSTWARTRS